jgi:hypothetical protein
MLKHSLEFYLYSVSFLSNYVLVLSQILIIVIYIFHSLQSMLIH